MHEAAICEALLDQVECEVRRACCRGAVRQVTVSVGSLAGVSPDALAAAFEVLRVGHVAQGATLEITRRAAVVRCRACGDERPAGDPVGPCGGCGGRDLALAGGDALTLDAIEIEERGDDCE